MSTNDRKRASDYPPEVLALFDGYVHGGLSRREFLERAAKYAVGGVTAFAVLESLSPNFAWAEQIKPADARIKAEYVAYPSPKGSAKTRGYLVRPAAAKAGAKLAGVAVIHENRGLNPYVEDVARRLAVEGYVAFAPDALAPLGGYPGDEEKARDLFKQLDETKRTEDMIAAATYLQTRGDASGKVGAVGFCYGGGICNQLASRLPWLAAAVPFYGRGLAADETRSIKAALQLHFAETDENIDATWPPYEAALKANKVRYEAFRYKGALHGFHNDTTPRYDDASAKLAWSRTLAFFKKHLA
jgi:carboxymethylenebutenolidase